MAMRSLFSMADGNPNLAEFMEQVDLIMPVPSSIWGRLRGKIDIPWLWGRHLAQLYGKEMRLFPRRCYFWRWKKRAKLSNKKELIPHGWFSSPGIPVLKEPVNPGNLRILVVDDVVTTGMTLWAVSQNLQSPNLKYLTMFRAADINRSTAS